jgi:hypothetical protein
VSANDGETFLPGIRVAVPHAEGGEYGGEYGGKYRWRHYDAAVACAGRGESPPSAPSYDGEIEWLSRDWAILTVDAPLPAMRVYQGDPAKEIPAGAFTVLASYFDVDSDVFLAHEHPFQWRAFSRPLIQGGHSGAPILWNGHVVATFTGVGVKYQVLGKWLVYDRLQFVAIDVIRKQAAAQGFSL